MHTQKKLSGPAPYGRKATHAGFTIVELLIVIVVIAILAAISIVAYTGIQSRANDSAVQNDLSNFAKKVELLAAGTGSYPVGSRVVASDGSTSGAHNDSPSPAIDFVVTKSVYSEPTGTGTPNFIYCEGTATTSGAPAWAIFARGKSLNNFRYSSIRGLENLGTGGSLNYSRCTDAGIATTGTRYSYSHGYWTNSGGWRPWVE